MANFDSNRWYQVNVQNRPNQDLVATPLFDHNRGSVFFQFTNTSLTEHQWQIFPFNSSVYVMRTRGSGPLAFMSAQAALNETTPGHTIPSLRHYTITDDSRYWQISPWGDGTFYLTNLANGTAWHLTNKPTSLMAMSSNITAPQDGQRFTFNALGAINDGKYSTVATFTATATSTDPGATSTTSPTSVPSSGGLSTDAAAGIGAGVGALALIVLLSVAFVFYRRRRKGVKAPSYVRTGSQQYDDHVKEQSLLPPPSELPGGSISAELPVDNRPHELPADIPMTQNRSVRQPMKKDRNMPKIDQTDGLLNAYF